MILHSTVQGSLLIVLQRGDKLIASLTDIIRGNSIQGGSIVGLGGVCDVELGYYDLRTKTYHRKKFNDADYELLSLQGNIAALDNAPFVHAHATLGKPDFSTFGGHLFEATVAVVVELTIIPLGRMPKRQMNESLGLATICGF